MTTPPNLRGAVADPAPTKFGARTELRLLSAEGGGARYEVRWFIGPGEGSAAAGDRAPDAHGVAIIEASGRVVFDVGRDIPDWLRSFTEKLLRVVARSAEGGNYPRRLSRWRDGAD